MSAFQPQTYAEALEKVKSRTLKVRRPLKSRSDKAIRAQNGSGATFPEKTGKRLGRSLRFRPTRATKKKKAKRVKLPSRSRLVKVLDSLTSQIVRLRDGHCVLCLSTERLQCGHIFGRRSHGARFDITENGNCHGQCAGCNQRHNYDPNRYFRWFITRFGQDAFDSLYTRWAKGRKYSQPELREMVTEYTAILNRMEN